MSATVVCPHISIFPLTWKHLFAFAAPLYCFTFCCILSNPGNKNTEHNIKEMLMEMSHLAVFQNSTKSKDILFLIMFREYGFHHTFWPTNLILGILLRTGFMCNCPLECRLRPTNSFCSCHKLTLNPGALMYIVSTLKHCTFQLQL